MYCFCWLLLVALLSVRLKQAGCFGPEGAVHRQVSKTGTKRLAI